MLLDAGNHQFAESLYNYTLSKAIVACSCPSFYSRFTNCRHVIALVNSIKQHGFSPLGSHDTSDTFQWRPLSSQITIYGKINMGQHANLDHSVCSSGVKEFLTGEEDRRRVRSFEQPCRPWVKPQPKSHCEDSGPCQLKTWNMYEEKSHHSSTLDEAAFRLTEHEITENATCR